MAKIDVTKIEGYDKMTPEQQLAAVLDFEYDDGASEIERYKNAATKANSEAAEWKKKHNALLSDEDKSKQASEEKMAKMQEELDALRRKELVSGYVAQLVSQGYESKLAKETAEAMADGDMAKVFANQTKFLTSHDNALRAEMLKGTPTPPAGGKNETMTYEKLRAMSVQERYDFSVKNPDEYKKIYSNSNGGNE